MSSSDMSPGMYLVATHINIHAYRERERYIYIYTYTYAYIESCHSLRVKQP